MSNTVKIPLSPPIAVMRAEAQTMGLGLTALLTADLTRYRTMAQAAAPTLSDWEWSLLSHVLSGVEGADIIAGIDALPSPRRIMAEIDTWADGATDDDTLRAGKLRAKAARWSPLTIAGVLFRLRDAAQ